MRILNISAMDPQAFSVAVEVEGLETFETICRINDVPAQSGKIAKGYRFDSDEFARMIAKGHIYVRDVIDAVNEFRKASNP